ncbi:MAG TPA: EAL domain-containing protein [Methylophilaceae bacterium]|nr:EAL domain-containing protein [Methylophilaceae bacterium]
MQAPLAEAVVPDYVSASLDEVQRAMAVILGRAYGYFRGILLDSAFQPIYSIPHRRIVGHESLLRATGQGGQTSPFHVMESVAHLPQSVFLDRLCRSIHIHNYQSEQTDNLWLFLNVSAQVINRRRDHEPFFAELLAHYNFSPRQVVVEIVEGVIPDFTLLTEAVKFYRDAGCIVAIDDFGVEASDIERIWRASPDIVKLDRKLIAAAEFNPKARGVLKASVDLIHEAGSLALLEGVETAEQAMISLDSNADLVQGFYFAKPSTNPLLQGDGGIGQLVENYQPSSRHMLQQDLLQPYILEFKCALLRLASGMCLEDACAALIGLPMVEQCYVLEEDGTETATLKSQRSSSPSRFVPLQESRGANWAHKPYHYRAVSQPDELQISRPYLSVTSSRLCITLSSSFQLNGKTMVLCCDKECSK